MTSIYQTHGKSYLILSEKIADNFKDVMNNPNYEVILLFDGMDLITENIFVDYEDITNGTLKQIINLIRGLKWIV